MHIDASFSKPFFNLNTLRKGNKGEGWFSRSGALIFFLQTKLNADPNLQLVCMHSCTAHAADAAQVTWHSLVLFLTA